MSPRRSSRARSSNAHSSSHQSSQSSRGSRHKRNDDKDDAHITADDGMHDGDELLEDDPDENGSGNEEDEGETRCVCGFKEYQGGSDDGSTDATDGLFIQCDQCKVWQHGLCVGIRDTALAPENYFCEMCKPAFHSLYEKKGGRKYSNYIGTGDGSDIHSKDHPTKRRSTMNSRDAAYDEQVLLQRAIEESKVADKKSSNPRSRKRGTSEGSDEIRGESKRQRTSNSPDKTATEAVESTDEKAEKSGSGKKGRGTRTNNSSSSNNNNNNASSSKRSSNRNRGREKGESRREESEQSDEQPRSTRNTQKSEDQIPTISTPVPEAPDTPQPKRSGRAANGRRQRNRNRNRQSEDLGDASSQVMTRDHSMTGVDHSRNDTVIDKPAKPRLPGSRTTLQEMRKRVNGISDFIARTQIEMAEDKKRLFAFSAIVTATSPPASTPKVVAEIAEQAPKMPVVTGINGNGTERSSSSLSSSASPPSGVPDVTVNGMQVTVMSEDPEKCVDISNLQSTEIMDLVVL